MGALLKLFMPLIPYVLGALLLFGGIEWDNHRCNDACKKVTAELVTAQDTIKAAHDRSDFLAGLYAHTLMQGDKDAKDAERKRLADLAPLQARIKALSSQPTIHFSADAWRLFNDDADFANAARPPPIGDVGAAAIPETGVDQSEQEAASDDQQRAAAYADVYAHWKACVAIYNGVKNDGHSPTSSPVGSQ